MIGTARSAGVITLLSLLVTGAGISAATDSNYSTGLALLSKGAYGEAAEKLTLAWKENPSDAKIALTYARVAPCSVAVALFTRYATDTAVSDSLRATAYSELGDYSFVHSAFKTAAERYRLAASLRSETRYRHRWALASAALHDNATARSLWQTITLEHGIDPAKEAYYHLALLDMEEGVFDSALVKLDKCGPPDTTRGWTLAATAAKLECAVQLGKSTLAKSLEKQLQSYGDLLLERDLLALATIHGGEKKTAPVKAPAASAFPSGDGEYTLQVGAFGSLDNATRLQKKLEATFGTVTVLPVTLSDQVFYRVRVGAFGSREAAEAFGKDSLQPAGISYKAVGK